MTIKAPRARTHTYLMQQSKEAQDWAASLLDYCSVQGSMVMQWSRLSASLGSEISLFLFSRQGFFVGLTILACFGGASASLRSVTRRPV